MTLVLTPFEFPALPPVPSRIRKPEFHKGMLVAANVKRDKDGVPIFGRVEGAWVEDAYVNRLCQLCGKRVAKTDWCVFPGDFGLMKYQEAPLHVECARYSLLACPRLRKNYEKIGVTVCKKYEVVKFEAPYWNDPGVIPLPPSPRGSERLYLSLAHDVRRNDEGEIKCATCPGPYLNQQSYIEFMKWSNY